MYYFFRFQQLILVCSPRVLNIPGNDLKNVCVLRSPEDANYIAEQGKGKNVVIIGTSFIGKSGSQIGPSP